MNRPGRIDGATAWRGCDLRDRSDWIYWFDGRDGRELASAVGRVRRGGVALEAMDASSFPLPGLASRLAEVKHEILEGRGFVLLRGFPVDRFSRTEQAIAYWGIGTHLGHAVSQNAHGHLLGHVRDLGLDPDNPEHRVYATNYRHRFHTDSCDVVGLLCLHPAKRGGLSSVVSSVSVHNGLRARRPDLADVLFDPFPVDRKGEIPAGKGPFYEMPICHWYDGELSVAYARDFIEASQRHPDAPRLTNLQIAAMDAIDELAASDDLRLDMELRPGDMQFLHNHQVLHARTAYQDHPDPARRRHLLRLWLCPDTGRRLPGVFAERYGTVEVGNRGGIMVPGVAPSVSLAAL